MEALMANKKMEIKTFLEYQKLTHETAEYPEGNDGLRYLYMGLAGEVGELLNLLKKVIRGDHKMGSIIYDNIASELGDVMWYLAEISNQSKLNLNQITGSNIAQLEQKINEKKGKLYFYAIRLNFITAELANIFETGYLNTENKIYHLSTCINFIIGITKVIGYDIEKILVMNIRKLKKRKKTGTIKGSGESIKERKQNKAKTNAKKNI